MFVDRYQLGQVADPTWMFVDLYIYLKLVDTGSSGLYLPLYLDISWTSMYFTHSDVLSILILIRVSR